MKSTFNLVSRLLLTTIILLLVTSIQAQSENQLFVIHEDNVYPSHLIKYEKAVKNLISEMKKHNYDVPYIRTSSTRDFTYYYLRPINNFADLDKNPWKEMAEKLGKEKSKELMGEIRGHYESHRNVVFDLDNKLSFYPEKPRFKMVEAGYLTWDFYYIKDGYEKDVEKLLMEFKKICIDEKITDGYQVYKSIFGAEFPLIVIVSFGINQVDLAQENENKWKKIKEKVKPLQTEFFKYLKKYEQKTGWPRADLSYFPEKKTEKPAK